AVVAASTALIAGAPIIGISAAAVGNAMLAGFTLASLWHMGSGGLTAWRAAQRHDYAAAEQAFEEIGAGGADLAATVGPAAIGKAYSILRRTEAGQALGEVASQSKLGRLYATGRARLGSAFRWTRESVFGKLQAKAGQSEQLATLGERARGVGNDQPRLRLTLAKLNQWRVRIAQSGTVRRINRVFDTLPAEMADRLEGKAITWVNYRKPAELVRDWGLNKAALQRGESPAALQATLAARQVTPPVVERHAVVTETLSRGSVPVSEADMKFLAEQQKIKTIVSLLHPENPKEIALLEQERALAAKYGVKLVNLPLPFGVDPPPEMVERFLATVDAATPNARVYVHCRLGRDRTGTMVGIFRQARQGMSGDQALAEMKSFGFDPERDTYLAYLAKFVQTYMTKGALKLKQVFLVGDGATIRANLRSTLPAQLPIVAKKQGP
ncbi:MAG: hypothetical protein JWM80_355, partial [Cyanobacteria bacterium RYN_339]|nr:hypothetical protein [Cyanobacteria bacterium RYN_339]